MKTREEILKAIEAWQKENEERTAFVILTDEEQRMSQAVAGKRLNLVASIVMATRDEKTRELVKGSLEFGEFYSYTEGKINEEVEKRLNERKE